MLVLLAVLIVIVKYIFEQPVNKFATYEDLEKSDLIQKGWLPDFLPKTSKNISERHNLDTNTVEASFEFNPSDSYRVERECKNKKLINNGFEFTCKYEDNYISIKLLNNGVGYLSSTPLYLKK